MLKFFWCLVISVLLSITVWSVSVEARPQFLEALNKVTEVLNDTTISILRTLTPNNTRYDNNKTKTRILFGGELSEDFEDQDIIFPDTYQAVFDNVPRINSSPRCAKGQTFCEDLESYPYQQVKEILKRKKPHTDLFGKDEVPDDNYSITNRNGDFEAFICTSIQRTIFPQIGKNKNNKWKYIINQGDKDGYIQGVRIELCRKEGSACDLIGERANGYITSCKQKYMLRRMMSLTDNGDPVPDSIQLPSACCCSYRKDLSFLTRFGAEDISARTKIKTKQF